MKKIAFIGAMSAAVVALVIALAHFSVSREGVKLGVARTAEACSKTALADCLPQLEYVDTKGTKWTGEQLAGKVVMVNFWATWCGPCLEEIPALTAAYRRYGDAGFVLLGVMTDEVDAPTLEAFSKQWNLDYPVIPLNEDIWRDFGPPAALPTTFVYDRAGKLRLRHRGALDESSLRDILEELLAEQAQPR